LNVNGLKIYNLLRKEYKMCEYCESKYNEVDLRGSDGIVYDEKWNKFYIYAEHYRNEVVRIDVDFCPKCGNQLEVIEE
jgi:hypothetical protein